MSGTLLHVYLHHTSCLCQDSWIQINMVDLGCGFGNVSLVPSVMGGAGIQGESAAALASDLNLASCLDFSQWR